jgi:PBSX family phage terminase large subunit
MKLSQYFKFNKSDYHIENLITGHKFIPFGMDEPEKTKGLDNVTDIWWDEITKSKTPTGFTTLNALLRSPSAPYLQFAISFNPVSKRHWIRHFFFDEIDAYSLKKEFEDCTLLNHSTLFNNDFIDKEAYQETLMLNSSNSQNSIIVDINGQWGEMDLKNPFLYALSARHLTEIEQPLNKDEIVYISFDFNISPCVCVIGQYYDNTFHIIKVITAESAQNSSALQNLCKKVNVYLDGTPSYLLRITGDASGKSGSADRADSKTFYSTIKEVLVVSDRQITTRRANTTHNVSQEITNYFFDKVNVVIHSCHLLTDDLYSSYMDENISLNKAKKEHDLHVLDAFRYLIDMWASYNKNSYLSDISVIKKRINGFIKS